MISEYGYHKPGTESLDPNSILLRGFEFNRDSSYTIEIIWLTLTLSLIYYYSCMVYTLNKSFNEKMTREKTQLKKIFGVMLACMCYRVLFLIPFGEYYSIICYKVTR